jgi:nitrogen fixation protein FixH
MKTLLVVVTVIGLGAVAATVIVGLRVFDGVVVDQPYERGVSWDAERIRREKSGLETSIDPGSFRKGLNEMVFHVVTSGGLPVEHDRVSLRVSRFETREHSREYEARKGEDGALTAPVYLPLAGRWEVTVTVEAEEGPLEFRHEIYAQSSPGKAEIAAVDCSLDSGPCVRKDGAGVTVSLEISPRPVRTMEDIELTVQLITEGEGGPIGDRQVTVDLTMPGMYMGENRIILEPAGEGRFVGKGVIVRCPSGQKRWKAVVSAASIYPVEFTFLVDR